LLPTTEIAVEAELRPERAVEIAVFDIILFP